MINLKIIVDAFGGDNAPLEIIKGSKMAQDEFGYDILLVGSKEIIKKTAESNRIDISRMQIIDANDIISMKDEPISIMKSKNRSSMAIGLKLLKEGAGDAFVSAGNSGALAVGATLTVKRIKGIKRCAFAPVIPKDKGWFMLIDSGANVECRPEMLEQFGIMGSVYMENVMHVQKPKVGLVNVGIEPTKGSDMYKHAYDLMRKNKNINFVGNIEARDIPLDGADVVVADGFTGNIILKFYEGMSKVIFGKFKTLLMKNFKTKIAALAIKSDLEAMKKESDYKEHGGAPLIGISKPVFKAHGSSDAKTFKNAIKLAGRYVECEAVRIITEKIGEVIEDTHCEESGN